MSRPRSRQVSQPQEVPDEQYEQVFDRVCAVDVGKQSGKVCTRVPHPQDPRRRWCQVWDVPATTTAVSALAGQLLESGIQKITLESTSDYWRIWYYLFEDSGLDVQLVNARDVKNVPGRPKTDKLDAVWLAKLTEKGMLRSSFVPPEPIRNLRDYTRTDLIRESSRHWQRLEKLLEDALIKVSSVASSLDTLSARAMIEALIDGERDPRVLAALARGRMRSKNSELIEALTGRFDAHHGELARIMLDQIDALTATIEQLTTRIDELITEHSNSPGAHDGGAHGGEGTSNPGNRPLPPVQRLAEIPGIGITGAQNIIAETGLDMTQFPTAAHLVSWAKLSPRTIQSGTRQTTGKTGKGNPYLKAALGLAAATAARTDTFLGERYKRLVKRRGKPKALVAVARSILVAIWHLLADPTSRFHDLGADHHTNRTSDQRRTRNHIQQLEALGYTVTLTAA
ncbi:IS110 family transposase [Actinoplanes cyaneus]|uniref:IS110 family transposase n=1 Tax=Actinoplanes cyaneus TaxID=52696 RepID=A0A919IJX6_9ACTN|nr:IS110 family transposase [Actinoplanes cyaneus]MCW2138877.1 Transposase [Actinoplanes cyaneus]GID66783.1 IS110 family transposase [Actinoplanes cyaneus]